MTGGSGSLRESSGPAAAGRSLCAATTLTLASTDPADPGCPAAVGYVANCALAYPNPLAADPILAKQLWVLSDKLIGTKDK